MSPTLLQGVRLLRRRSNWIFARSSAMQSSKSVCHLRMSKTRSRGQRDGYPALSSSWRCASLPCRAAPVARSFGTTTTIGGGGGDDRNGDAGNDNGGNKQQHIAESIVTDTEACADLFAQYASAKRRDGSSSSWCLDYSDYLSLLAGIGEHDADDKTTRKLFDVADWNGDGLICLDEFLENAVTLLGSNPARIILVVGGPGSGKNMLSGRLEQECNLVHLSSNDLLRSEVDRDSPLGRQVRDIMERGELVSSAAVVSIMKRRMRDHPGKRVLLSGFPRSPENAADLVALCGAPELALHLETDDTVLIERIMDRGGEEDNDDGTMTSAERQRRDHARFETALQRIRTFHRYHQGTMEWLRQQHVPVVNLDCSGDPDSVWKQLLAIGRLMRPAVKHPGGTSSTAAGRDRDWSGDPWRSALF